MFHYLNIKSIPLEYIKKKKKEQEENLLIIFIIFLQALFCSLLIL